MKRFVTCLFVFVAIIAANPLFISCSPDLSDDVTSLENRVNTLEGQVGELQKLMNAVSGNLYITGVETITNGYVLNFSDGTKAIVTNGTDGSNGDSIFKSVDLSNADYVVINMTDGSVITIPTFASVSVAIEGVKDGMLTVMGGVPINVIANIEESSFTAIAAEIKSADGSSTSIATKASAGWKVNVGAPVFAEGKVTSELTVTTSGVAGDKALLTVSVLTVGGQKFESSAVLVCDSKELRVLTFEGEYWNSLIDSKQYGGPLLYGESGYGTNELEYYWIDETNTLLGSQLICNWGSYAYWNGGHAISNYVDGDLAHGSYTNQLSVYKKDAPAAQIGGGHNGSNNFCMHFGYHDNSGYTPEELPMIYFSDGTARVVDHMWVNNSLYAVSCYLEGNGLTAKIGADDWVKIIAIGTDAEGNTKESEFYLCNGPENIITEWTKWDLSGLGAVVSVEFNITGSSDNGYGFSQPGYFAYDDVAVVFDL